MRELKYMIWTINMKLNKKKDNIYEKIVKELLEL